MILSDTYTVKQVTTPHAIEVTVPGSKSITNRALLIAALAQGKSTLRGILFSDDSRVFLAALQSLGFSVDIDEENRTVVIEGGGGRIPCAEHAEHSNQILADVYVGSAGTAARFLTAFLGLSEGSFRMTSSEQMKKRPMKELLDALSMMGAEITYEEEDYHFPFIIRNHGWATHHVTVDVDKSSQFLSALLISSVLSSEDVQIDVTGSHGMAYVRMTLEMMKQFQVEVQSAGEQSYRIGRDAAYCAMDYQIEPDLSAACYFYAMSPILSVPAKVHGVQLDCLQGDSRFLSVLSDMGCTIEQQEDGVLILPPDNHRLSGGAWDLSGFSDQALTLAAIAPFADSPVIIHGISHIRYQECDRIQAIETNLAAMGIQYGELADGIMILPGVPHECTVETFEDHRVAMAFSIPGLVTEGIRILNPKCCRKTFENYFEVLENCVY